MQPNARFILDDKGIQKLISEMRARYPEYTWTIRKSLTNSFYITMVDKLTKERYLMRFSEHSQSHKKHHCKSCIIGKNTKQIKVYRNIMNVVSIAEKHRLLKKMQGELDDIKRIETRSDTTT